MNELELLTTEWIQLTDSLLKLEMINMDQFKSLVEATQVVMLEYSDKRFIPKELCALLLELQWFSWWVADLENSPMHGLYQEIGNTLFGLIHLFFGIECQAAEEISIDSLLSLF